MTIAADLTKAVQERLTALGYYSGKADGAIGPLTEAAIVAFKSAHGLNPRLFVGEVTLAQLFDESAGPAATSFEELPWMAVFKRQLGLHESRDLAQLSAFLKSDGHTLGDPRRLPWCGDLVETCIRRGLPGETVPNNPYLARNWTKFGVPCEPEYGAVLPFWRGTPTGISGHVGFYLGETATHYKVGGGNQNNAITDDAWIEKRRLLGARWPTTFRRPATPRIIHLDKTGRVSTNEV